MSPYSLTFRAAAAAALLIALGAPVARAAGAPGAACTARYPVTLTPGPSMTLSSGVNHSPREGTVTCADGRRGTVRFDGRYGTTEKITCTSGGDGWGILELHWAGERQPVRETLTYTFGGLAKGLITGAYEGETVRGHITVVPTRGDCLTSPMSQIRVELTVTPKR